MAEVIDLNSHFQACQIEREKIYEEILKFLSYEITEEQNKRRNPRIPICIPVTSFFYREHQWDKSPKTMHALNLSATGIKLISSEHVPISSFIFIRFTLGDQIFIQVLAQVKWETRILGNFLIGLEFSNASSKQKAMLEQYTTSERAKYFHEVANKTGKNRRKYFRVPVEISASFSLYLGKPFNRWKPQREKLFLNDLSAGGAKLRSKQLLLKGQLVSFSFCLDETFTVIGKVTWNQSESNGYCSYGIKFVSLEKVYREAIIKFVLMEEQKHLRNRRDSYYAI